jgi:hypothetical protein
MANKTKKEKITYIDDGRTLADMSGVSSGPRLGKHSTTRAKDAWHTYWNAVRMMFLPMLAVIGGLVLIYLIMWIVFSLA